MKMLYSDKRIWIEDEEGKTVGEIDFLQDQNGKYDIVHTGVDPSQQGQGTAGGNAGAGRGGLHPQYRP